MVSNNHDTLTLEICLTFCEEYFVSLYPGFSAAGHFSFYTYLA